MKSSYRLLSGITGALFAGILPLAAGTVEYDFGQLSGGTPPAGATPWLQAVFTDTAANTVQLTLSAGNLTGSEFVSCWYFNLDPALTPTSLNFSETGSSGAFTGPTIQTGANGYKAGPDGKYDVLLGFSTAGGASSRFSGGDSITFTITGITGLTAQDFNFLSSPAGGSGPYSSAAHIQGIAPGDGSGWANPTLTTISTRADTSPSLPDGSSTIMLLGASFLAIEGMRRKIQTQPSAQ